MNTLAHQGYPLILMLVAKRPTYGYRRVETILKRLLRKDGHKLVNHKSVYRIMRMNQMLLATKDSPEKWREVGSQVSKSSFLVNMPVSITKLRV